MRRESEQKGEASEEKMMEEKEESRAIGGKIKVLR